MPGADAPRGSPCQSPAMKNGRCRMHGGPSLGAPKGNKNALKHGRYTAQGAVGMLMPVWGRRSQIKVAGDPRLDWAIRRCAMNMSVTQFVVPPAIVGRSRSVWHEIIDTVIEGPPRTAADEIAEYLARHQYDLSPTLRIELERRHVCV